MNRKGYREVCKNRMDGFDSFACVVTMALIIAINIQAINSFLAKYNDLLDERRVLIFGTGVSLAVFTVLITKLADRIKANKIKLGEKND